MYNRCRCAAASSLAPAAGLIFEKVLGQPSLSPTVHSLLNPYLGSAMLVGIVLGISLTWLLIIAPFSRLLRIDFNDPGD
jgi:hypothetical protein